MGELPSGKVCVTVPSSDDVGAECLRDLKRTLEGGSVYILGRGVRYVVTDSANVVGDVSRSACENSLGALRGAISGEFTAQGLGALSEEALKQLSLRVASHISVTPGIQAVLSHAFPPALFQPTFLVCIGPGQVRVFTLAFVGELVSGDRPGSKCTPFILSIRSGNLAGGSVGAANARYAVQLAVEGVTSALQYLDVLEPELRAALQDGGWATLDIALAARGKAHAALLALSSVNPGEKGSKGARRMPATLNEFLQGDTTPQSADKRNSAPRVVDRAARMRSSIERQVAVAAVTA